MLNKNANCYIEKKNLNTTLSEVRSRSISQFFKHFQLIFDNSNVNDKQIKQKRANFFFCKLFRNIKFFFLILLGEATLESIVTPTNRNSSAFLLHTSKTFSKAELFFIFSQTFLKLIFATKIKKKCWNNQLLTSCQK